MGLTHDQSSTLTDLTKWNANLLEAKDECTTIATTLQQNCTSNIGLFQQQCSGSVTAMLHQCSTNSRVLQQQCTPDMNVQCNISVATMRQQCRLAATSMQLLCGNSVSAMQKQCSIIASAVQRLCNDDAAAVQRGCGAECPPALESAKSKAVAVSALKGTPAATSTNMTKTDWSPSQSNHPYEFRSPLMNRSAGKLKNKHVLMIYAGLMRSFAHTVHHHLHRFILPNEKDGWSFRILVNTDMSKYDKDEMFIRSALSARCVGGRLVTVIDDRPTVKDEGGFFFGRVSRSLKYMEDEGLDTNFDAAFFVRPDVCFLGPEQFIITKQCESHPGLSFLTSDYNIECGFHNQDWDFMHLACNASREDLQVLRRAYGDPGPCKENDCKNNIPPPRPSDFHGVREWHCGEEMCTFVAEVGKAGMRFGTMADASIHTRKCSMVR